MKRRGDTATKKVGAWSQTALLLLALSALLSACSTATPPQPGLETAQTPPSFGPHTYVFDPSMDVSEIEAVANTIHAQQVDAEMGTNRYALLFKPGVYGSAADPLQIRVGYYTEISGLGATPGDVVINGKIEVYNRCLGNGGTSNCIALNSFWRTLSNLTDRKSVV